MSPIASARRTSAPSPKLGASGTAPTIDSDWTTHLDRLRISAFNVNPDPVPIAVEGALWGSITVAATIRVSRVLDTETAARGAVQRVIN
jgi:hypothetical protein